MRKLVERTPGLDPAQINGSGKDGRILKEDVLAAIESGGQPPQPAAEAAPLAVPAPAPTPVSEAPRSIAPGRRGARRARAHDASCARPSRRRLKDAQNTAAMLTTFNEVDMSAVMEMRKEYRDLFEKKHGVRLGFMGFFVKACIQALREVPDVNAEIDGTDVIYKNYYHIGIAVGTERGLVVPVVRDAHLKSLAEIERSIGELGAAARDGKLGIADMQGRHLHHHQWRRLRIDDVDADIERAAIGHFGNAQNRAAADGRRWRNRGAADDVSGAFLRSPRGRWTRRGHLPGSRQGKLGRPAAPGVGALAAMPNGRPGDHPYTDIVGHKLDLGEPEIAERVRALDAQAELDVREILSDLLGDLFLGPGGKPDDWRRERLLRHLATLERLCAGKTK